MERAGAHDCGGKWNWVYDAVAEGCEGLKGKLMRGTGCLIPDVVIPGS